MGISFGAKQVETIRKPFIDGTLEVSEGTPRSGKTTTGVFRAARFYIESQDQNHLILGYNQEQAFKLFIDCDGYGLQHIFTGNCAIKHNEYGDHLELTTPDGKGGLATKHIYYKGGGKADSYKAFQGLSFGSVVFLEIDLLHNTAIQEAFRRTFAAKKRWHLADLNPPSPQHPVIKDVFEKQNTLWTHWTMDDNPIMTEERKQAIFETLSKNPFLLERDWYGHRCIPQGVIYSMFSHTENIADKIIGDIIEMFFAGDGGISDPTSYSCYLITMEIGQGLPIYRLYRAATYYHSTADSGADKAFSSQAKEIVNEFIPYCRNKFQHRETENFVDPACKALREELTLQGLDNRGADNNAHDVTGNTKGIKVGIARLKSSMEKRHFLILEDERYGQYDFLRETSMYVVDKHGNPIDAYNHALDECRYAHNYYYKNYIK